VIAGLCVAVLVAALLAAVSASRAGADSGASCVGECTISQDTLRSGWDADEPELTPADVQEPDFGQLFATQLPTVTGNATTGPTAQEIYAQPLIADGYLVVATEENNVYGLNPETGAIDWSINLGPSWPASTIGCGDLVPDVGITSTPVYDPTTQTLYVMAKTWTSGSGVAHPIYQLSAIDLGTISGSVATEVSGWPVTIAGDPTDSPGLPFNGKWELQRAGLLLLNGVVYAGFGSHCDLGNYAGYVAGVSTSDAELTTLWSAMPGYSDGSGDANGGGGIWQGGGGLVNSPAGSDNIYLATGNGSVSPSADLAGSSVSSTTPLSESVIHLQVQSNGSLKPVDFFSPLDNTKLNSDDTDLGSGGPMVIPAGYPTASSPPLVVQDGKDGRVWLLDRDNLGGTEETSSGSGVNAVVDQIGPYGGVWGHPAFFGGDDGYVYYDTDYGPLIALKLGAGTSAADPTIAFAGQTATSFGYTSGSPVVTSEGTSDGSAVVWIVGDSNASGPTGADATLQAYAAVPSGSSGTLAALNSWPVGTASKFTTVATYDGRVYVGNRTGEVFGFGSPTGAPLAAAPLDFGENPVGTPVTQDVTVTGTAAAITIYGASASGAFAVDGASTTSGPVSFPYTLTSGQTLQIAVTYTPTVGSSSGSLVLDTHDDTSNPTVSVALAGVGTQPGLGSYPTGLSFGTVPTGATVRNTVTITNTGADPFDVTGVTTPGAPFAVTGLPSLGDVIGGQGSVTATVAYSPTTAPGPFSGNVVVTGTSDGATYSISIPVSGSSIVADPHLAISPTSINFGTVPQGSTVARSFTLDNTGNINIVISKAAPPAGEFSVVNPVGEGSTIDVGTTIVVTVDFRPTTGGPATGIYTINPADGQGPQLVHFTGVGAQKPGPVRYSLASTAGVGRMIRGRFASTAYPAARFRVHSGALPPGLVLHSVTGMLTGRPTRTGSYSFTVAATNAYGTSVSVRVRLSVRRG
jgi:hypothetical protein